VSWLEIFARRHTEIDLPPSKYIVGLVDGGDLIKKMSWNDVRGFLEVVCIVFELEIDPRKPSVSCWGK
jgi:hypothetical protein